MTHYIAPFTERRGCRDQRAVCGVWVTFRQHSTEADCPACKAWLEADDAEAQQLAALWDQEDATQRRARAVPVTHFVPYDAPGGNVAQAVCGQFVDRRGDHASLPTCPVCIEEQAKYDALAI